MFKIYKNLIFIKIFLITFFVIFWSNIFGAQIDFYPSVGIGHKFYEISVGQEFKIDIYLNSENQSINTFSGEIVYPADLIELKNILDGGSIINFWIDKPQNLPVYIDNVLTNKNKIYFSGITPGGFNGRSGFILSLIFKAKNSGLGFIFFQNGKFLLNDGEGTEAKIKTFDFNFNVISAGVKIVTSTRVILPLDNTPPEDFNPQILRDLELLDGKYVLIFQTSDKGSGIDHYEVLEWKRDFNILNIILKFFWPSKYGLNYKKWIKTQSPYVLVDQKLQSDIYVKAVDKAGNERIVFLPASNQVRWYKDYKNWIIIIIIGMVVFILLFKLKNK